MILFRINKFLHHLNNILCGESIEINVLELDVKSFKYSIIQTIILFCSKGCILFETKFFVNFK